MAVFVWVDSVLREYIIVSSEKSSYWFWLPVVSRVIEDFLGVARDRV